MSATAQMHIQCFALGTSINYAPILKLFLNSNLENILDKLLM